MIDISVCSTKKNGVPKGRPRPFAVRYNEQIIYPHPFFLNMSLVEGWAKGIIYRQATGENRGNVRHQQDMYA